MNKQFCDNLLTTLNSGIINKFRTSALFMFGLGTYCYIDSNGNKADKIEEFSEISIQYDLFHEIYVFRTLISGNFINLNCNNHFGISNYNNLIDYYENYFNYKQIEELEYIHNKLYKQNIYCYSIVSKSLYICLNLYFNRNGKSICRDK